MRKINYSFKLQEYLDIIPQDKYDIMQRQWNVLRNEIIKTYIKKKKQKKQHAKKIFPPYINRIILGSFETLNLIYNNKDILTSNQKKMAKLIFNYGFPNNKKNKRLSDYYKTIIPRTAKYSFNLDLSKTPVLSTDISEFFIKKSLNERFDITTCYYCETQYINAYPTTIPGIKPKRQFELDHFLGKEECPITAISLFNLIPCCKVCNGRSIKGSNSLDKFYTIQTSDYSKFSPSSKSYAFEKEVKITVEPIISNWSPAMSYTDNPDIYEIHFNTDSDDYKKEIAAFFLFDRYNYENTKKEALNLLEINKKFPDSYLDLMCKALIPKKVHISITELREYLLHIKTDAANHRLFGKMKNDIL